MATAAERLIDMVVATAGGAPTCTEVNGEREIAIWKRGIFVPLALSAKGDAAVSDIHIASSVGQSAARPNGVSLALRSPRSR